MARQPATGPVVMEVGFDNVMARVDAIKSRERIWVVDADELVPQQVSVKEARELLSGIRDAKSATIVTCKIRGPNLFLYTVEYLGDKSRMARPALPGAPTGDADNSEKKAGGAERRRPKTSGKGSR